jgi:hypothetical protein
MHTKPGPLRIKVEHVENVKAYEVSEFRDVSIMLTMNELIVLLAKDEARSLADKLNVELLDMDFKDMTRLL